MKRMLVLISFGLMILLLIGAYFCTNAFWQAVAINAGTSFMSLGVGLIFVNIYLERNAKKGAVRALLILSSQSIVEFHNMFLDICWAQFGRDAWGKIQDEYTDSNGQPSALRQDVRDFLYDLCKNNQNLRGKIGRLRDTLVELSRMVGWDLDASLLESCLQSRISINSLMDLSFDDTDISKNSATEYLLDIDINSQITRRSLMIIAGIDD